MNYKTFFVYLVSNIIFSLKYIPNTLELNSEHGPLACCRLRVIRVYPKGEKGTAHPPYNHSFAWCGFKTTKMPWSFQPPPLLNLGWLKYCMTSKCISPPPPPHSKPSSYATFVDVCSLNLFTECGLRWCYITHRLCSNVTVCSLPFALYVWYIKGQTNLISIYHQPTCIIDLGPTILTTTKIEVCTGIRSRGAGGTRIEPPPPIFSAKWA